MADEQLDARGLSCPEPVLMVKRAIEAIDSGTVELLVDTATSKENCTRMALRLGCSVEAVEEGDEFRLTITKS